jgi:hypothetical protein
MDFQGATTARAPDYFQAVHSPVQMPAEFEQQMIRSTGL